MNRFEQAVYDCMKPTARLLQQTTKPLHRALLLNFWRHVHLEGAGEYDKIVAPDMMVDRPVYRVTWGANPAVIEGKEGVLAFYKSVVRILLRKLRVSVLRFPPWQKLLAYPRNHQECLAVRMAEC